MACVHQKYFCPEAPAHQLHFGCGQCKLVVWACSWSLLLECKQLGFGMESNGKKCYVQTLGKLVCEKDGIGLQTGYLFLELKPTQIKFFSAHLSTRISACAHWHTRQLAIAHWRSHPKTPYSADQTQKSLLFNFCT